MKKIFTEIIRVFSFFSIMFFFLLSSCTDPSQSKDVTKDFRSIVDEYFESYLELDPLFATSIGDHRFDDKLTISISKEQREKQLLLVQRFLSIVKKISSKNLTEEDFLTYEMFIQDLQNNEKLLKVDLDYLMPFNQFNSFFPILPNLLRGLVLLLLIPS